MDDFMKKSDDEIFLEYNPFFSVWYKVLLLYIFQFTIFLFSFIFFLYVTSVFIYGALVAEFIVVFLGTCPYKYIGKNIKKIRKELKENYKDLAVQHFWFKYESYTIPLLSSSLYFPLLLRQNFFVYPKIINLPENFVTTTLFTEYFAIPFGIILVILGFLIRRAPSGFSSNIENYLYMFHPEKSELVKKGLYRYIRHPRYLSRGFIAIGFGIFANSFLAIFVGFIHFIVFCSVIPSEEKELKDRFKEDYRIYQKNVPALIPKFKNLKNFLKIILTQKDVK